MNPWWTLLAAAGGLAMIMIDATGTTVALPSIQRDLGLDQGAQQWIITIYALTLAAAIATGGRLCDIYGRARVFSVGVVFFASGSLICGLSPNLPWLLCGRIVEGLGNIMMAPAAALLATQAFGPNERGKSMGIYTALGGLAMMGGPIIAGLFIQHFGWRSVFFVNLPVAVLTLLLLRVARPRPTPASPSKLSIGQSLHLAAALTFIVLALQESHRWLWTSPLTLGLIGGGLVLLAIFVRGQWRSVDPLVDVRLLLDRRFAANGIVLFCAQFSTVGQSAYSAIYLQRILHFTPVQTGLSMLIFLTPLMLMSIVAGRLFDRFGIKVPAVTGLSLATLGVFLQTQVLPHCNFIELVPALILIGAGLGLAMSQTYTDGTARVSPQRGGQAFGILDTVRQLGGAMGMAAIGTIVVSHERTRLLDIVAQNTAPGPARDQFQALLVHAAYGQTEAADTLHAQWPAAAESLRISGAQSIADGFYIGGAVMALGLLCSILFMQRKPKESTAG